MDKFLETTVNEQLKDNLKQVNEQLAKVGISLVELEKVVNNLEENLTPIIRQEEESMLPSIEEKQFLVPLAEELHNQYILIISLIEKVVGMQNRLEID